MSTNSSFRSSLANVYLIDGHAPDRRHHQALLTQAGLSVETFDSGHAFLNAWHATLRGCVLTELLLPDMPAVEVMQRLAQRGDTVPSWIVLTSSQDVRAAAQAVKHGAADLLAKPVQPQTLVDLVRQAMRDDAEAQARHVQMQQAQRAMESLSPREKQVLDQLVQGAPNKSVAAQLGLSQKTVASHRARILQKLNAQSLVDLVRITQMVSRSVPAVALSAATGVLI